MTRDNDARNEEEEKKISRGKQVMRLRQERNAALKQDGPGEAKRTQCSQGDDEVDEAGERRREE